jgi:hypothetical protein
MLYPAFEVESQDRRRYNTSHVESLISIADSGGIPDKLCSLGETGWGMA